MSIRQIAAVSTFGIAVAFSVSACGPNHSSTGSVDTMKTKLNTVVSAPANVSAENNVKVAVTTCINGSQTTSLLTKAARKKVESCLAALVPPAKRTALEHCVANGVITDKAWTKAGRVTFENTGAAACVNQINGK